jgi:bifunctional DNase/RNase
MQRMQVTAIGLDSDKRQAVLLLREAGQRRRMLPVPVSLPEAVAIERESRHERTSPPRIHQLIGDVVRALGRRVDQVRITEMRADTFVAELVLDHQVRISAQVSDAVALAVHLDVPIFATDAILAAHACVRAIEADDLPMWRDARQAAQLQWFRCILDAANPEDFGRGGST